MAWIARLVLCSAAFSLILAPVGVGNARPATERPIDLDAAPNTTENDAIKFGAATWVDLQRVTGADPLVNVDMRGNGRVFVDFPWGRTNTNPTLPNIVARSLDHGDTFRTLFQKDCPTSNSQPRCGDPGTGNSTLALSPNSDNVYLSGHAIAASVNPVLSASASHDAGDTWPISKFNLVTTPGGMDRPWLLAPGGQTAYLAWNNVLISQLGQPSVQYATTQDGGASWTVDPNPKYAALFALQPVMDRSAQSPAHGTIYQVFRETAPDKLLPKVGIAVSTDGAETFQTHHVGDDLACGDCDQGGYRGFSFPWVTVDTAGNIYAVWGTGSGSDVVMYTSHISDPANDPTQGGAFGKKWTGPVRVSTGAAETAVVGKVVAGSPGNVAIVYYGTPGDGIPDSQPNDAEWHLFVAHSANALDANPAFTQSVISHRPVHTGGYCTGGLSCPAGGDRGLRNWMGMGFDPDGRLYATWSDDNNGKRSGGTNGCDPNNPDDDCKRTGIRFAKQLSGPALIAGKPPLTSPTPSSPMFDPSDDATWPNRISGGVNLPGADLTRVALHNNSKDLRFRLSVGDVKQLKEAVNAIPSASRLLFVVRFETAKQDYFAAYEYSKGGAVRAYTGRINNNDKVENGTFENAIGFVEDDPATATVEGNTITITQGLSKFDSPPRLLSVVGASLIGPAENNETRFNLLNTIDATRAFDHELGGPR